MRKLIVIAVTGMVVALAAAVGPASAAPASQLTLAATPNPVVIGQAVTFTGRLTAGGAGVAGATVTFGEYFDSSCTIGPFFTVPATTDASGNYNAGTYPTTGAPAGRYYFKATSGPTSSGCLSLALVTSLPAAQTSGAYLCYSNSQTEPGVWDAAQAVVLAQEGYWEPTAVDGNIPGGTNVGNYHLQCNATPKGDGYVGAGGEFYGPDMAATAQQNLGFYPH